MSKLIVLLILASFIISSCDNGTRVRSADFNVVCINGVAYYERYIGYKAVMAVAMNRDSTVILCDE